MRSPGSSPIALVVLVVVVALAAACGGTDGSADPVTGAGEAPPGVTGDPGALSGADDVRAQASARVDTVVMIGDSITVGATPALAQRFAALGLQASVIDAQNGRRMVVSGGDIRSGTRAIESLLADPAAVDSADGIDADRGNEVWVVALGTNDVAQYSSPDEIAAAVNEVLATVPDEVPLVWVDIHFEGRADQAQAINAIIGDRVARRGNAVVAPWHAFAPSEGAMTSDGVHPTPAGADLFAFVVTDTVRDFLGA